MRLRLFYFLCFIVLCGCAVQRDNKEISQEFLKKPSSIVIAQISGLEKPRYIQVGQQGMLDVLINQAVNSDLHEAMETIQLKDITEKYYDKNFSDDSIFRKFDLKHSFEVLVRTELLAYPEESAEYAPYDFRYLKKNHNVHYALILEPSFCGLMRNYYGFIPLEAPYAQSVFSIYLVDLKDNRIVAHYNAFKQITISGEWDVPPNFYDATKAIKDSLTEALNNARLYFSPDLK